MERMVSVVQTLSFARDIEAVMAIVRDAARHLTEADGATFILPDGDQCYYADENVVGPLLKGQRFPMSASLSGWAMLHGQAVVIPDIHQDPRIPAGVPLPAFVKSMAIVPIRRTAPIGAIGTYWAAHREPTTEELTILQALADTTAVALENVQLYEELQTKVQEVVTVNRELLQANEELERFTYICSHDMHEPARMINTYATLLQDMYVGQLDKHRLKCLNFITLNAKRLQEMLEQIISFSKIGREAIQWKPWTAMRSLRKCCSSSLRSSRRARRKFVMRRCRCCRANPTLVRMLFRNLIGNALKFQKSGAIPEILIDAPRSSRAMHRTGGFASATTGSASTRHLTPRCSAYFNGFTAKKTIRVRRSVCRSARSLSSCAAVRSI